MDQDREFQELFDRVMTHMLRTGKLTAKLSRDQIATTRHVVIAGYMAALRARGEPLATVITKTCRQFKISERTAATAWDYSIRHVRERQPWDAPKIKEVL